jgi:hypothetical protein
VADHDQRRAWQQERERTGLTEDGLDLMRHPALARLGEPRVGAVLLPADPLAPLVDFDQIIGGIPTMLDGKIRNLVSYLNSEEITGTHALRASKPSYDGPAKFVAGVARHGGAVAGVGPAAFYITKSDAPRRLYRLFAIVAVVRTALQTQAAVLDRLGSGAGLADGPWELTIAAPGARGALLGAYADGWQDAEHVDNPPMCTAEHPVARLEIEQFPTDPDALAALLNRAMSRVVNIFGTTDPLYAYRKNRSGGVPKDY